MSQGSAELDGLSDLELQRLEIPARTTRARKQAFVPVFPLSVLGAVVEAGAEKALPLLLAIHRQLKMTERVDTAQRRNLESCWQSEREKEGGYHLHIEENAGACVHRAT